MKLARWLRSWLHKRAIANGKLAPDEIEPAARSFQTAPFRVIRADGTEELTNSVSAAVRSAWIRW
ncbi:MAG: hypothetical protein AB7R55_14705 [Gemmatimonadales bacterium]